MIDINENLITDIAWEKLGPSKDGVTDYRITAKYDGCGLYCHFLGTDELMDDEIAKEAFAKMAIIDFVEGNPPA